MIAWTAGNLWPPINHDAALLLDAADRMLNGDRLYVDIIDMNPPLIFYLSAIPELLEDWTNLPSTTWFIVLIVAAIVAGALACRRLGHRIVPADRGVLRQVVPLAALFVTAVFPDYDFGQREHLLLIALCPYLLLAACRWQGVSVPRWLTVAIALAATIGFALKPTFLLVPAVVELALLARRGWGRTLGDPVPWLMLVLTSAYGAAVIVFLPEYFSFALPFGLEIYRPVGNGSLSVLFVSYLTPIYLAAPLLVWAAWRWSDANIAAMLTLPLLPLIASAVIQGMGWRYHAMPAMAIAIWLGLTLAAEFVDRVASSEGRTIAVARLAATAPLLLVAAAWIPTALAYTPFERQLKFTDSNIDDVVDIIREFGDHQPVMIFSVHPTPAFPAVNYAEVPMRSRFQTLWAVVGAYANCPTPKHNPYRSLATMPASERFAYNSIVEDFVRARPALLFVQTNFGLWRCDNRPFDFIAYFRGHPQFERAFRHYTPLMEAHELTVYYRGPADIELRARAGELASAE
ncbi:MAG: hypothetical protein EXQ87_13330 [Alphaproteobacteria bacterium]|nr:hypothetical protein [Alphaproteobacteria bacterium]